MKTCKNCNLDKPLIEFYKNNSQSDGLTLYCKSCSKEKTKTTYKKNPQIKKFHNKKHILGKDNKSITYDTFTTMLENQNNKCGICNLEMIQPYIDHNHATGKVRMLLCHHCNTLLGMAKENTDILQKSIDYLNTFNKVT